MTHDPFAISNYPLESLPEVRNTRRADFETDEFGPIWVEWLGGVEPASEFVRSLFEPKGKRGGKRVFGTGLEPEEIYVVPAASGRDDAERNLALATVISVNGGHLNEAVVRALPKALDVEARWRKRADAISQATHLGELQAEGKNVSESVARVAQSIFGSVSESSLYDKRKLDMVRDIAAIRAEHLVYAPKPGIGIDAKKVAEGVKSGKLRRYPHAADTWFADGKQDQVAQAIVDAIRTRTPGDKWDVLRWDIFNLIECYHRRDLPLSSSAQVALDYGLGLVDLKGNPVLHAKPMRGVPRNGERYSAISLGGVSKRLVFMDCARISAGLLDEMETDDNFYVGEETRAEWESSEIFRSAVDYLLAQDANR